MIIITKIACITIYLLGAASALGLLPAAWNLLATAALVLLGAHLLEVLVMFRHIRRYPGPLAVSVMLTLLFGLAHWLPLARQALRNKN